MTTIDYCDYCETEGHTFRACPRRDDGPSVPRRRLDPDEEAELRRTYEEDRAGAYDLDRAFADQENVERHAEEAQLAQLELDGADTRGDQADDYDSGYEPGEERF